MAHPYENYFTEGRVVCRAESSGLILAKKNPTIEVGSSCSGGMEGERLFHRMEQFVHCNDRRRLEENEIHFITIFSIHPHVLKT